MPMEMLMAVMEFVGMQAISVIGYWSATRQSDAFDGQKRDRPLPAYHSGSL